MRKIVKYASVYGICWILVLNCGQTLTGTGGFKHSPNSGGNNYTKIDTDSETTDMDPTILPLVTGADSDGYVIQMSAPAALLIEGEYLLWYSFEKLSNGALAASSIELTSSTDATSFTRRDESKETINAGTVLWGTESWEGNFVEAPAVILDRGTYKMWYEGGDNAGIGYATSSDGTNWTKEALPVLTPGEDWEGGSIGNPTVIMDPYAAAADQRYKMWYDGNSGANSGIGYATSPDGLKWTKRDASGRFDDQTISSDDDNVVAQVIWPDSQGNFTTYADFDTGSISAPFVIVHSSSTGSILYKMWYTGETLDGDFNNGYAASPDGINWEKSPFNPVLHESALLEDTIPFFGPIREFDPMVIPVGTTYYMFYTQVGIVSGVFAITRSFLAISRSLPTSG